MATHVRWIFLLLDMTTSLALHKYLNTNLISIQAEISSRKKLLEHMAQLLTIPLDEETKGKDIYHCLLEREKLGNTGIGNGVALPHSRSDHAQTAIIAIITLKQSIDYDSIDRQPVDIAFGLLVPKEATQEHLNLLADIARVLSVEKNKKKLSNAATPDEMVQLIKQFSK